MSTTTTALSIGSVRELKGLASAPVAHGGCRRHCRRGCRRSCRRRCSC